MTSLPLDDATMARLAEMEVFTGLPASDVVRIMVETGLPYRCWKNGGNWREGEPKAKKEPAPPHVRRLAELLASYKRKIAELLPPGEMFVPEVRE